MERLVASLPPWLVKALAFGLGLALALVVVTIIGRLYKRLTQKLPLE